MKVIALDCEYNQPSGKTIEIGAVCFNPQSGHIYDTFSQLVDPMEPIHPEIVTLTGITDVMVKGGTQIKEVVSKLTAWKSDLQANPICVVWGSGKTNDIRHIYEEAGLESPFKDRIIDVKGAYMLLANAGHSDMRNKAGLEKAMSNVGLTWNYQQGAAHRATADALNTMRMYMFLSHLMTSSFAAVKNTRSIK